MLQQPYDAETIAAYIINTAIDLGSPVTNPVLQRILFTIQTNFLARTGSPAFYDNFEAWAYGPIIPNIYYKYGACYGIMPITTKESPVKLHTHDKNYINPIIHTMINRAPWEYDQNWAYHTKTYKNVLKNDFSGLKQIIPLDAIKSDAIHS